MLTRRRDRASEAWWIRGMAIALALLTLATGFCLFDRDDHGTADHAAPLDLCLAMLAASLAVIPFARLLAVGRALNPPVAAEYAVARRIPEPPPRPVLFR